MILNLGPELRSTVWDYSDWSSVVPKLGQSIAADEELEAPKKAVLLRELAELCEFCVLDPQSAADFYSASYQSDRSQFKLLARMRRLCHSMGRTDHAARTAELEFRHSKDPRYHTIAGQAWLDAGEPDRALAPLLRVEESPNRDPNLAAALEVARRDWASPEKRADELLEEARASRADAPIKGLQAARILRLLDIEDERYEQGLRLALSASPNMHSPCHLMEHYLFSAGRLDDLADHFRRRAESAPNEDTAARILLFGSSLLFRADAGSEGGPLFMEGIILAIKAKLRSVPGLLAQLRGLVASASSERKHVVELAEQAFPQLFSEDEQMGVSIFCAQIAYHAQKDEQRTQTWLNRIRGLSGDHPLLDQLDIA